MSAPNKYRKNIYSQFGEDGVIQEIGSFVEFGAWGGKHFSNTYHLLEQGWNGIYIEGDEKKFDDLMLNMRGFQDRVTLINAFQEQSNPRF